MIEQLTIGITLGSVIIGCGWMIARTFARHEHMSRSWAEFNDDPLPARLLNGVGEMAATRKLFERGVAAEAGSGLTSEIAPHRSVSK